MATIRRRQRASRDIGPYRPYELLFGEPVEYPVFGYTGYGDGSSTNLEDFISDEMASDWAANRDELMAFWHSGEYTMELPWLFNCGNAGDLPWATKQFDAKKKALR